MGQIFDIDESQSMMSKTPDADEAVEERRRETPATTQ
jgi:hypothetical protein